MVAITASAKPASWTLATEDTSISITVSRQRPTITHLQTPGSQHDWVKTDLEVPLMNKVWVGEQEVATDWTFARAIEKRSAGELTLLFTNVTPRLSLKSIWRARPGHGPVEHWIEIGNWSGQRVTVSDQASLVLAGVQPGGPAKVWWVRRGGSNASTEGGTFTDTLAPSLNLDLVSNCEDGASPIPWLALQVAESRGLYVGWEFSGLGGITARATEGASALDLRIGNRPDFKTDVEPGETFLVPPAFVGCYTGDIDDGSYTLHRWVIEKLRPPMPKGYADPTLAYNLYLDAGGDNAREADVLRSAAFCHKLGFETFMPDAMWFPECGDWRWDPKRFPHGIGPIEKFVHRNGMKQALWCAWSNGGISQHPGALSVRGPMGHPDWFNTDFAPDWKPGPFYGGRICLGCRGAREWAIAKTQWLVGHHRLDYLKHDCGPIVTHCNKRDHRHRYGVDVSYWSAMGYYEVQEKLRRAYPRLVLENCSGGGHIKDYGAMARTHYVVATDTLSNLPDRQSFYDSTFALPPLVLQAYTYERAYHVPGDEPGSFLWRSAMMGAWQIDPTDTRRWTDEERASAQRAAAIYKEWIRPLLRDVKVHHILPRPDGKHWDGMFYWGPSAGRGTLYIFRPDAGEAEITVKLKGLEADRHYRLWCEDGSMQPGVRTGAELMQRGLSLRLPERYTSDLVYVQDAAQRPPKEFVKPGMFRLKPPQTSSAPFGVSAKLSWTPSAGARCYRVTLSKSADFAKPLRTKSTLTTMLSLAELPPDCPLFWKVEALAWNGRRLNEDGGGTFRTPKTKDLSGVVFVSDLPWVRATAGAGNPVRRDTNYYGQPIRVGGQTCAKGVWTHAFDDATPADVVVDISGLGFKVFAAVVGVEASAGGGSVQFQVLADGSLRAESPVLRQGQTHSFHVDVAGTKQITLRVLNGGDGFSCDHAAWGLARFIKDDAIDPFAADGDGSSASDGKSVSAAAKRTQQILTNFAGIKADFERLKADIADQIRVRFDLAPELLLPGEPVQLTVEAHATNQPNPTLELLEDCYQEAPVRRTFSMSWKKDRTGTRYTAKWRWRPPRCGNYQIRWTCDFGGDIPEFRRNFSVIDHSYLTLILNSTSHREPRPEPDFHELGLPFSYWAEEALFGKRQTAEQFVRVSRWARQFGDDPGLLIFMGGDYFPGDKTIFYDEPEAVQRTLLKCYREFWPMLGFPRPLKSLYTYGMGNGPAHVARSEGFDLLGALCADQNWGDGPFKINHWGMPARPYFVSREDFRKTGDGGKHAVVGIQQCERLTVPCRDYNCVYAFEGGIAYALDQYSGVTRRRVVDDAILSREMDFLQCFVECAGQTDAPMFVSCGIEFNGVWPDMAAINRHFMEYLVRRARDSKLAFTTATVAADFLRRHARRTPETVLYLPDVYAGITSNGKPVNYPDTMEIENGQFRAIFRRGEMLPYARYDYTTHWQYPDWGNTNIPRDQHGYVIPNTDNRFRVTPRITDTRPFTVSSQVEEIESATRVSIEVDARVAQKALTLAVWDLPREYSKESSRYRLRGAQRFIPVRAPFTGNLNGIIVADIKPGKNHVTLTVRTPPRVLRTLDLQLNRQVMAKVFERDGGAMAYLFCVGTEAGQVEITPPAAGQVRFYPADSDTPTLLNDRTTLKVEPGKCVRLAGLTFEQLRTACPEAQPVRLPAEFGVGR